MAQWNHADRTLHAKLVYYGPAFGGKTTNLESLHRITDPDGTHKLLSVKTSNDRTLFFDLLPFDLGDILGYQVAMKLYTVPGQVRYDTTRQVVLGGADALVFVADSSKTRREQNVWSLQNLHMNMRAKGLDRARVPVLHQFNKQDVPDAATPEEVAGWLGVRAEQGFPAVALDGRGVLETFMAACRAMLEKLVAVADDRTRRKIDSAELGRQIDRAFAPHLVRVAEESAPPATSTPKAETQTPIVLHGDDLLERAVQTGVRLGEQLSTESARANRLEREAEAFRRLSESLRSIGATFDRDRIIDSALNAVHEILEAPMVSLVRARPGEKAIVERGLGCEVDPLLTCDAGRELLRRMHASGGPCVVEELSQECPGLDSGLLRKWRAVVGVPCQPAASVTLLAYAAQPDGAFKRADVRFVATVAGHLAAGLEKARLHDELAQHRDRLEETVAARTEQLREAYENLRKMDQMRDTFLSNLSHEMKSPLTAILGSAYVIRDYESSAGERRELVGSIISSAETLQRQLDDLFRLVNLETGSQPLALTNSSPELLAQEAIQIAGHPGIQYKIDGLPEVVRMDLHALARAVANLIDNAVKFSPPSGLVKIVMQGSPRPPAAGPPECMTLSVLDRGPGVGVEDRERIFAPFEQGGDPLTSKPSGAGIGLHETRMVVMQHGGTVEYLPRKGGGSEFRIVVPVRAVVKEAAVEKALA